MAEPAELSDRASDVVGKEQDIGDDEAQRENLCRRQTSLEQHLRKDEGAAPDSHNDEG